MLYICVCRVSVVCSVDLCGGLTLCDVWMYGGVPYVVWRVNVM